MKAELVAEIRKIRELIKQRPNDFRRGKKREDNVRDNLVIPLLHKLGWNSPPYIAMKEIEVKLKNGKGQIDITLSKGKTDLLAFEVKRLGERIGISSDAAEQLADYLIALRINLGVTTDGVLWNLYRFQAWSKNLIWSINLIDMSPEECADKMMQIHSKNIEHLERQIELAKRKQGAMYSTWEALSADKERQVLAAARVLQDEVKMSFQDLDIQVEDTKQFLIERYKNTPLFARMQPTTEETRRISTSRRKTPKSSNPPKIIRVDSEKFEGGRVHRILTCTAEWLIKRGHLTNRDCPVRVTTGQIRYLVNTKPVHQNGESFRGPQRLTNDLYIETSYNIGETERMARRLLEKYAYAGDLLHLEY